MADLEGRMSLLEAISPTARELLTKNERKNMQPVIKHLSPSLRFGAASPLHDEVSGIKELNRKSMMRDIDNFVNFAIGVICGGLLTEAMNLFLNN
jgi:hypothetical protein